jgi:hypothetical protein
MQQIYQIIFCRLQLLCVSYPRPGGWRVVCGRTRSSRSCDRTGTIAIRANTCAVRTLHDPIRESAQDTEHSSAARLRLRRDLWRSPSNQHRAAASQTVVTLSTRDQSWQQMHQKCPRAAVCAGRPCSCSHSTFCWRSADDSKFASVTSSFFLPVARVRRRMATRRRRNGRGDGVEEERGDVLNSGRDEGRPRSPSVAAETMHRVERLHNQLGASASPAPRPQPAPASNAPQLPSQVHALESARVAHRQLQHAQTC